MITRLSNLFLFLFLYSGIVYSQKNTFTNPILSGAYPDPSICKVGDDYYLSNSSFEFFPGVPVWHSKDLVHWEHASFGIHRKTQFNFEGIAASAGAWAGTIRYHEGIFYLPLTWVDWRLKVGFKNVVLTATNPSGPWSDPYTITDSIWGIDPSIFFDEDGKAYWLMNHPAVGFQHPGAASIMLQEIDLKKMKLVGTPSFIGRGAMIDSQYPEGPKMFKKDDYYYLLIAEGGTGQFHSVTISRSKNIKGPYENYQGNPLLTHRALGYTTPFINIGHADMVKTDAGEWWMVCLGSRPLAGKDNILGRETFLVPVKWEKGEWPIVSPSHGQVRPIENLPKLPIYNNRILPTKDDFNDSLLTTPWTFIRTPRDFYSINKGNLVMNLQPEQLSQVSSPAFIGKRLQFRSGTIQSKFTFNSRAKNEEAGLVLYKSEKAFLKFVKKGGNLTIVTRKDSIETVLYTSLVSASSPIQIKILQSENLFSFEYQLGNDSWITALSNWNGDILSVEKSGGFMGAFIGIYASSNGQKSTSKAHFDFLEYTSNERIK